MKLRRSSKIKVLSNLENLVKESKFVPLIKCKVKLTYQIFSCLGNEII